MYSRGIFILIAVLGCAVSQAQITLTSNGSTVDIDEFTATITDWTVGGTDQVFQNRWYFRDGDATAASLISTISAPVVTLFGTSIADVTYSDGDLTVSVRYSLKGALNGITADLAEQVSVDSATGISLRLFQYNDFDVDGSFLGDTATRLNSSTIGQTDGSSSVTTGATPIPGFSEISTFAGLRTDISTTVGYNLNTAAGSGIGESISGDMTFGFQWNQTLGDRGSFSLSTNKVAVVPEPASMAVLGLGALALLRRRKRK